MSIYKNFPEQELKNDLITVYNEIQEAQLKIPVGTLNRVQIKLETAIYWLRKYISGEDILEGNLSRIKKGTK